MYGHNVSHSKRRTRKIFKPNLHSTRILVSGRFVRVKLCTKCLRMVKKVMMPKEEVITEEVDTTTSSMPVATA